MAACVYIDESETSHKEIYLGDHKDAIKIIRFIADDSNKKKFLIRCKAIFENSTNRDIYEKYSDTVSAFKFKGSTNTRIYCKLQSGTPYKIILTRFVEDKKSQALDKKLESIIKAISKINYDKFWKYKI